MIRYATNNQPEAAKSAAAPVARIARPVALELPPVVDVSDTSSATVQTKSAAVPLELSGEPAPKSRKAASSRKRDGAAKPTKADGSGIDAGLMLNL